jgi:hypothetical protein
MHGFNSERVEAVRVEGVACCQNSWDTDEIEGAFGKWHSVLCGEDNIDNAALIGNEEQGAAGGGAEFCAEGMVVRVGVGAEKAVRVGKFAAETYGVSANGLAGEEFEVPLAGHFLSFGQIGDKPPDLSERQVVQAVVITELECAQRENREQAHRCDQEFPTWKRPLWCRWHVFVPRRSFARCHPCK